MSACSECDYFSRFGSRLVNEIKVLVAQLCPTLCDPIYETPLSMRFSRREYWSGLPFPSPGDLPHPEVKSRSASAGRFFTAEPPGKPELAVS